MDWVRAGDFDRIVGGTYPRRGDPTPPPREAAGDAAEHYAERFRAAFKDAGDSFAGASEQLADWLRRAG